MSRGATRSCRAPSPARARALLGRGAAARCRNGAPGIPLLRGRTGTSGSGDPPAVARHPAHRRRGARRRSGASWPTRGRAPPPAPCGSRAGVSAPPARPAAVAVRPRAPSRRDRKRWRRAADDKRRHLQTEGRERLPRLLAEPEHVRLEPHLVSPPTHGQTSFAKRAACPPAVGVARSATPCRSETRPAHPGSADQGQAIRYVKVRVTV